MSLPAKILEVFGNEGEGNLILAEEVRDILLEMFGSSVQIERNRDTLSLFSYNDIRSIPYNTGEIVFYESNGVGRFYQANQQVNAGPFDESQWEILSLGEDRIDDSIFEEETEDYYLYRKITGRKVLFEIAIKPGAGSFATTILPSGTFKHFFYERLFATIQILEGTTQNGDTGSLRFNKLLDDDTVETVALPDGTEHNYSWSNLIDGSNNPRSLRIGFNKLPIIDQTGMTIVYTPESVPSTNTIGVITVEGTLTAIYDDE